MKKMLLKCLTAMSLVVATSAVFAEPTYQISNVSISDALNSRQALAQKTLAKNLSIATDIIVVNYSNSSIILAYPGTPRVITERTSARITSPDYSGLSTVILQNASGAEFWRSGSVYPFDTISVYISAGKYVVYDTHN